MLSRVAFFSREGLPPDGNVVSLVTFASQRQKHKRLPSLEAASLLVVMGGLEPSTYGL